ncbi:hypothetical protein LTR62_005081 [Meristemomyces frigidus]|uniref:Endoplasmic reticulum lectin n=1 Tax=Meristemomyces frigidus TaxID=1508187 RepID=A0AAN7THR8_9PEZI|nr:hypothetical protein LTR62_005081 [Meristemomyces frigidus]
MKHFFALPAVLRASLLLASASQHSFSPNDDLLAFPQYDVKFVEAHLSELEARAKLQHTEPLILDQQSGTSDDFQQSLSAHVQRYEGKPTPNDIKEEVQLEHEYMVLDGQRYVCSVPQIKPATSSGASVNDTLTKAEEEKELSRATDRGWELLSGMQGNCVYFISGWWSYSFCYGKGVRQFHQLPPSRGVPPFPPVEDPTVPPYTLGKYANTTGKVDGLSKPNRIEDRPQEESDVDRALDISEGVKAKHTYGGLGELVQRGESRYLVQRLEGGTTCDLTGKERTTEVQFHCNPQSSDRISLIQETRSCAYLMVIQTPRLCSDVAFLPPQKNQPNTISCSPILGDDEVEEYERSLAAMKAEEKRETDVWKVDADAAAAFGVIIEELDAVQIVGDIVVGGHMRVPEGTKLEKSAIVGGGKETYIDTIASSEKGVINQEELKKLGVSDAKAVEELKKRLENIAQGQQWKLDVIDTPRGREYRGIIGDEDEAEEGKKEEGGTKQKKVRQTKEAKQADGDSEGGDSENSGSQEEYYHEEL